MIERPFFPARLAFELAPVFVPRLSARPQGTTGQFLGPGVGASLEFEDRRSYAPGDDLRHVDWRVLARTGELLVQVYREEVQPRLDVLLDASRSMATEPEKAQMAVDLGALFLASAEAAGFQARCWRLGASPKRIETDELRTQGLVFDESLPLGEALHLVRPFLSASSLRFCLSDFLTETAPGIEALTGAGGAALVQVLGPWEADPPAGEKFKMIDAKNQSERELSLDPMVVGSYRKRLERLVEQLVDESRRLGMAHLKVIGGESLRKVANRELLGSGLLEPA